MTDILTIVILIVVWVILQKVILPRLGIPT